jgi:hypothetical protein
MMVDFEPPILACVMGNRDYSFDALKTMECVYSTSPDKGRYRKPSLSRAVAFATMA